MVNEGTNSESREGQEVAFRGKSACYGAVIPFREGKKQTKSQAPADKHGEKLSGVSEEVPQHGAMKPVCFHTLCTLLWILPAVLAAEHDSNTLNPSCTILDYKGGEGPRQDQTMSCDLPK